tara:strand:+ start:1510 stop:2490 length:981 start_codon:yes stop_codon:yes gene_type:complete
MAAAFAVGTAGLSAPAEAQTKIRVGYSVVPIHQAPLIFQKKSLTKHQGKSYTVDMIHFRGSAHQLTAVAAGELDLAVLAFSTFGGGIVNAKQDLVALADVAQDGPKFSTVFAVLDNSSITSVKDLKGKVLAINGKGGGVDMAARTLLLQNGLKPGFDVTFVEARFGAMEAMLRQKKTDVAVFVAPFWARVNGKGGVRPLFRQKDGLGNSQFLLYAAKRDFVQKNRAVLVDWLEDYVRGTRWLADPKNRQEALEMTAAFNKRPAKGFAGWAFTKEGDYHHDQNGLLDMEAFQNNVDVLHKLKILRRTIKVADHTDLSLVKEAAARLK